MTTTIKVGDRVTWRPGGAYPKEGPIPIGIGHCLVKDLADDTDHGPCALLGHWLFKQPYSLPLDGLSGDGTAWVKVSDLEPEDER